jgi:hypothetical protein
MWTGKSYDKQTIYAGIRFTPPPTQLEKLFLQHREKKDSESTERWAIRLCRLAKGEGGKEGCIQTVMKKEWVFFAHTAHLFYFF